MCEANRIYKDNVINHKIVNPTIETEAERNILAQKAKKVMVKSVKEETLLNWIEKVKK